MGYFEFKENCRWHKAEMGWQTDASFNIVQCITEMARYENVSAEQDTPIEAVAFDSIPKEVRQVFTEWTGKPATEDEMNKLLVPLCPEPHQSLARGLHILMLQRAGVQEPSLGYPGIPVRKRPRGETEQIELRKARAEEKRRVKALAAEEEKEEKKRVKALAAEDKEEEKKRVKSAGGRRKGRKEACKSAKDRGDSASKGARGRGKEACESARDRGKEGRKRERTAEKENAQAEKKRLKVPVIEPYKGQLVDGKTSFPCTEEGCTKPAYKTKQALWLHVQVDHQGQRWQCEWPACHQEFRSSGSVSKHVKNMHKGVKRPPGARQPQ